MEASYTNPALVQDSPNDAAHNTHQQNPSQQHRSMSIQQHNQSPEESLPRRTVSIQQPSQHRQLQQHPQPQEKIGPSFHKYIKLRQGKFETSPTYVRFGNFLAILSSMQFAAALGLTGLGITILAYTYGHFQYTQAQIDVQGNVGGDTFLVHSQYLRSLSGGPQKFSMLERESGAKFAVYEDGSSTQTPQKDIDYHAKALQQIWVSGPIWSGGVSALSAAVGLFTVYVPGTLDSLRSYLVLSIISCILLQISTGVIGTAAVYLGNLLMDGLSGVTDGSILVSDLYGDTALVYGLLAGSTVLSAVLFLSFIISSVVVCASLCNCGPAYTISRVEHVLKPRTHRESTAPRSSIEETSVNEETPVSQYSTIHLYPSTSAMPNQTQ